MDCVFCLIAYGRLGADLVLVRDRVVVARAKYPDAPVHLLVISLDHVPSLAAEPDAALLGDMLSAAATAAREAGLVPGGYRVVINTGDDAGQTVKHLHAHVLGGEKLGRIC